MFLCLILAFAKISCFFIAVCLSAGLCKKIKTTNLKLWGIKLCSQADEISTVSLTHFVSVPLDVLNLTTCAMETMPVESQLAALLWRRH